jgi:hypothetical protein
MHQYIAQVVPLGLRRAPGLALALQELGKRWLLLRR